MGRLYAILSGVVLAVAVASSGAAAAPRLWATVNVCDTPGHPDAIGIRGSMPGGGGRSVRMFMRFRVQYVAPSGKWRAVGTGADSGWVAVGSGRLRARQMGRTFTITPPAAGGAYVLRGVVAFEWRRGGHVVRRAQRATSAGHGATAGADPARLSAATCRIS